VREPGRVHGLAGFAAPGRPGARAVAEDLSAAEAKRVVSEDLEPGVQAVLAEHAGPVTGGSDPPFDDGVVLGRSQGKHLELGFFAVAVQAEEHEVGESIRSAEVQRHVMIDFVVRVD